MAGARAGSRRGDGSRHIVGTGTARLGAPASCADVEPCSDCNADPDADADLHLSVLANTDGHVHADTDSCPDTDA